MSDFVTAGEQEQVFDMQFDDFDLEQYKWDYDTTDWSTFTQPDAGMQPATGFAHLSISMLPNPSLASEELDQPFSASTRSAFPVSLDHGTLLDREPITGTYIPGTRTLMQDYVTTSYLSGVLPVSSGTFSPQPVCESVIAEPPAQHRLVNDVAEKHAVQLKCDFPGCRSKAIFKRQAELNRHKRIHDGIRFPCKAVDCARDGRKPFHRMDKLIDHVLAGHEYDSDFQCSNAECAAILPRDLYMIHDRLCPDHGLYRNSLGWPYYERTRKCKICPFQRCSYKTKRNSDDDICDHLISEHDSNARQVYKDLLAARGYHAETGNVLCPLCNDQFSKHIEFQKHLIISHFGKNPQEAAKILRDGVYLYHPLSLRDFPSEIYDATVTKELFAHRRTILNVFPDFGYHPVFNDLKEKVSKK